MKKEDEFYVGWEDEMPSGIKSFLKTKIWLGLLAMLVICVVVVLFQKPFSDSTFEFGSLRELTGTYYEDPLPVLLADDGQLPIGLSNSVLLVGYGKFGAEGIMRQIQEEHGSLSGNKVTLTGTLIYGDGKALLELTDERDSFVTRLGNRKIEQSGLSPTSPIQVQGEILDPKCYFGVMKPGEGKVHKSCAIRCISGGIPPVFRHETGNKENPYRYLLLLGPDGEKINQKVLPFVAEKVAAEGQMSSVLDWDVLYVDPGQIKFRD